jgi:hypothetical protein
LATEPANLKGYWKCDETSGTTLADSSGNSKNLTITGAINTNYWLGESGEQGTCFRTDGVAGYASRNDSVIPSLDNTNFTLFALFKGGTDFGVVKALAITNSSTTNDRAYIGQNKPTSQAIAQARGNSGVMTSRISGGTAFDGNWHSIAFRRNGTAFDLFVDGTRVASTTATLATGSTCNRTTLMHSLLNETTEYAKGSIQHAAIWNTSLSDSEIAAIQTARNPSATPAKSDFNGDDKADILWQNTSTGQRVIWLMNGTTLTSAVNLGFVATSWSIAGSNDFNGDGKSDILWQNKSTGERLIWLMNGTTLQSSVNLGTVPTSWSIAGSSDFNSDGKPDILWQNTSTGQRVIWLMNGTTHTSTINLGFLATSWSIAGSNDFNGDGKPDIIWQNTITGQRLIWIMNGTTIAYAVNLPPVPTSWSIAGTGDFNGDGKSDILWQNNSTGQRVIWLMNGTTLQSSVNLGTVPTSWSIRNY